MGEIGGTEVRSVSYGVDSVEMRVQTYRFNEELRLMMDGAAAPPVSGSSFKALLGLPENQAMELLHSSGIDNSAAAAGDIHGGAATDVVRCHGVAHENIPYIHHQLNCSPAFPSNAGLIERAAKYSFFATAAGGGGCGGCGGGAGQDDSPESSSAPSNSEAKPIKVKNEPADDGANPNSLLQTSDLEPAGKSEKQMKRKEREKKEKGSSKKSRKENSGDGEKLPYVHVRARRGQATDSHSLAERARREKINARMKLLQELVPGCNKISGTALVLDEIINHVQSLQRQVEVLSMRLAAVNPRIDFNLDSLFATENGCIMDISSFPSMALPLIQLNRDRRQCQQQQWHIESLNQPFWATERNHQNLITPENSLLSYDSSANSASLHSSQLKMEQ